MTAKQWSKLAGSRAFKIAVAVKLCPGRELLGVVVRRIGIDQIRGVSTLLAMGFPCCCAMREVEEIEL